MTVEASPRISRVRPRLRRVAITAFIVLLPVAAWTIWDYTEARRFARMVDEIQAKGEPVSLLGVYAAPKGAEPAARFFEAAAALMQTDGLYGSTGILNRLDYPNAEDTGRNMPAIRAWLEKNREAEELLERAPSVDFAPYPPGTADYTRQFDRLLRLAALADVHALERIDSGDPDGAARAVLQQLQLAAFLQSQSNDLSMMTGGMVIGRAASAVSSILEAKPSLEVLAALQDAMVRQDRDGLIEQALLAERAFIMGMYWDSEKGWFMPSGSARMANVSEPVGLIMRPYVMHLAHAHVQMLTDFLETSRQPGPGRLSVDGPDVGDTPPGNARPLARLMAMHSRSAIADQQNRRTKFAGILLAGVRTTVTAIAVERYRRMHDGALPAKLGDLIPNQLGAIPIDPFSGSTLLYKAVPDGFVVYSVATNRKDDGGQGAGTQLRRRWGANQAGDSPLDVGIKVKTAQASGSEAVAFPRTRDDE